MRLTKQTDRTASTSRTEVPAFGLVAEPLSRVKELIYEQLTEHAPAIVGLTSWVSGRQPEAIQRLIEYVSSRSGKMLRPALLLLAGRSCGEITDEHVRVAAIIEMIHNATLLHDDVIDEGQKRRGLPTVNHLWGNETAVLLGDLLLSRVFKMCAELEEPQAAKVIAGAAVRLCEGELRQAIQRHDWQLNESDYIEAITEKSAVLFSSACYLGALLGRANERHARSLTQYGLNAGIAFQMTDDLLDIVGDERKTGKTLGSDVDKHKLTLAVIHLLKSVDDEEKETIINSFLAPDGAKQDRKALVEILSRHGSLQYARDRTQDFVGAAVGTLAGLEESQAKEALHEVAKFMAGRVT
jgi:octaprenyl-diphosphate synthase